VSYQKEILSYQSDYIRLDRAAEIAACADAKIAELELTLALTCNSGALRELQRNDARYRWLRDRWYLNKDDQRCLDELASVTTTQSAADFDAAIDAAKASGAEFHRAAE